MLSSVLHSKRAALVNIAIMRAFVRFREMLSTNKELSEKFAALERRVSGTEKGVRRLFEIIHELEEPPTKPVPQIGFQPHKK